MKLRKIAVTRSVTINLGNYESERLEFYGEGELDEGEDPKAAYAELRRVVAKEKKDLEEKIRGEVKIQSE